MRQTAGELADRLHFLAVQQRLFQRLALGAFQHHVDYAAIGYRAKAQFDGAAIAQAQLLWLRQFAGQVSQYRFPTLARRWRHVLQQLTVVLTTV